MKRPFFLTLSATLMLAASPCAVAAQEVVQALPGTTDADHLGDVMRQLASNPQNVDALLRAGELSIDVGDLSGAAALFARAEKVDPRNGRVKAGMASILVRSERPGEALRYFAQAESLGLDPRRFATDRALAYDLVGQQDRAQRDYRVALRDTPDDETVRRYALSLGISGKQELALKQLAPLLQKTDRGAWRARAFILAMTGDVPAAERIATTMMPAGMAQGLLPFFARLPQLPAGDRAFAVHFGEIHATPERLADARMVPPLPVLGPDPTAPVMMAAAQPVVAVPSGKAQKSQKRDRRSKARVETAAALPVAVPKIVQPVPTPVVVAQAPVRTAPPVTQPAYRAPVTLAQTTVPATVQPVPSRTVATGQLSTAVAAQMAATPAPTGAPVTRVSTTGVSPTPLASAPSVTPAPPSVAPSVVAVQPLPAPGFSTGTVATVAIPASSVTPTPSVVRPVAVAPAPAAIVATPTAGPAVAAAAPTLAPATTPAPAAVVETTPPALGRTGDDSILARIVAGLSIPASELDVAPVVERPASGVKSPAAAMSPDASRVIAEAQAKAERDAAAKAVLAKKLAAEKAVVAKKAADKKAVADKKALAEKKAAAAVQALADKKAAEEKRIARANPERIWVQVAGGATASDLPKAWKAAKSKAPTVFAARTGWTTPLRATNRVLAGPFKTDAEARSFVNQLAKSGVSAFTFTSEPGQAVTRLPAK